MLNENKSLTKGFFMKVTLKDIAREAGVSVSMVSYVLNKSGRPTLERHKRILDIARKYNYVPDANARGLVTGVSNTIGLVVPQRAEAVFAQPFMVKCLSELGRCLTERHGWLSLCLGSDLTTATMRQYLANARLDGVIFLYADCVDDIADFIVARHTPYIFFDNIIGTSSASSIATDDRAGIGMAFDHLYDLGHRRILFLSGRESADDTSADQRLETYRDNIQQTALPYQQVLYGGYSRKGGYNALRDYLDKGGALPDAILAGNDKMAWGALRLLLERGVDVPGRVSVVGFDDADEETNEALGLTTVRQPIADMAAWCVQHLYACAESGELTRVDKRLMPELIVRGSTAQPVTLE